MRHTGFFTRPYFLSLFIPLVFAVVFFYFETHRLENETLIHAKRTIENQESLITHKLRSVTKDLNYLAENSLMRQYLNDPKPARTALLGEEFEHFSRTKGIYDQIRLIDAQGNEIIRVNYDSDTKNALRVSRDKLQNKKERYYFQESIILTKGEIYLSKLDLNIEKGEVEEPHKPMLRFARTVTDEKGNTRGIVILNYLADDMLLPLYKSVQQGIGEFSLLNDAGYWLVSPRREKAWGFMFASGREETLALQDPEAWAAVHEKPTGIAATDDALIYHSMYNPVIMIQSDAEDAASPSVGLEKLFRSAVNRWTLLYTIRHTDTHARLWTMVKETWYVYALLLILLSSIVHLLILFLKKRKEHLQTLDIISEVYRTSREGILITDEKTRILNINDAFTKITGYNEAEILGQTPKRIASGWTDPSLYEAMWRELSETGYWEGELKDRRKNGSLYIEWLRITAIKDSRGIITNYVGVFSDITQEVESKQRIKELAYYDSLTKLPNRNLFFDRLHHALERSKNSKKRSAVMLIDLDNFKYVNDTLGHFAGDKLLINVARRITECVGEGNTVSRLGGDEFIVLLEDFPHAEELAKIAQEIVEKVGRPQNLMGEQVFVGASIGIAVSPDDTDDPDLLIQYADTAMYRVKETGKSSYFFYTDDLKSAINERVKIETYLRSDIQKGAFELYYQPQVDNRDERVVGAEALIRWRHEELGNVPPMKFIAIAEDAGLIIPLSEWIIIRGFREIAKLKSLGIRFRVALNASPIHMMDHTFIPFVQNQLRHTGCDPAMVEFEITESSLAVDTERMLTTIQKLKSLGITVAVDDFGTGYSSLSYLKLYPIDKLKVDRAFVTGLPDDINDVNLTTAIISISRSFSMNILAEGVETESQLAFLQENECHVIQGYYYCKPLPFKAFVSYVKEKNGEA